MVAVLVAVNPQVILSVRHNQQTRILFFKINASEEVARKNKELFLPMTKGIKASDDFFVKIDGFGTRSLRKKAF